MEVCFLMVEKSKRVFVTIVTLGPYSVKGQSRLHTYNGNSVTRELRTKKNAYYFGRC